jgi:hypothetical protein
MTGRRATPRRPPDVRHLLAALFALCLISAGVPAVASFAHTDAVRGEVIVAATSQGVSAMRAVPERAVAHAGVVKQLPALGLLPAALLVALLLVLSAPRRSLTGAARQAHLLSAAGPGPPSHS